MLGEGFLVEPAVDLDFFLVCSFLCKSKFLSLTFLECHVRLQSRASCITAPFNNMRTLTFKAQPTNAFFATVNQVFGDSSQLPTTLERAVIKSLSTVQIPKQCSAVVGS